jgi:Sulfotransferase domain
MRKLWNLPWIAFKRAQNRIGLAYQAGQIDAVLASYPKSGRTWFRFILSSYLAKAFALNTVPDLHSMFTIIPNFDMDAERGFTVFAFKKHQPKLPLITVSHLPYSKARFRSHPVIFMVRDPRDVMVSAYFHATRQKHRFSGDIDGFLKDPDQGIVGLTHYLNSWSHGLQANKHIVISYEALSHDPQGQTNRALSLLGIRSDPQALDDAVDAARFQNMQKLELQTGLPGHDYNRGDTESRRMRRGMVGGFRDYLSLQQIDFIDEAYSYNLTPEAKEIFGQTTHR